MKKVIHILILVLLAMAITGCNKKDCNGDLDGLWQLTQWRDKNNTVKATKEDMIFYAFQLQMASFRKLSGEDFFMRSSLKVSPEQICIYNPIEYLGNGHDEIKPMSILSPVGVPEDGIFWILVLDDSTMELKTNNDDVLIFRKY